MRRKNLVRATQEPAVTQPEVPVCGPVPVDSSIPAQFQPDWRHDEWDVYFLLEESVALFRAEIVLQSELNNQQRDVELRAKRAPFLGLALKLVEAERERRWKKVLELLKRKYEGAT